MNESRLEYGGEYDSRRTPPYIFMPHWPEGLQHGVVYELHCDDEGPNENNYLRVLVAENGDVHVSMANWEKLENNNAVDMQVVGKYLPSVRCRTFAGGGRHSRTRQALLLLAQAIRLDTEENKSR